jgi:predicted amidohydrolase
LDNLNVALVQAKIIWHKPEENMHNFDQLISNIHGANLIALPEMWSSGFTMKAPLQSQYSAEALEHMKKWSIEKNASILGSLIFKDGDNFYNRLFLVEQGEVTDSYDKKHLFAYAGEDRIFTAGGKKGIMMIQGWKVCANICYDLRFPAWSRNLEDYDLAVYSANWPDPRIEAWDALLKARAIENQSYVLGINCFGEDLWGNVYSGHSSIIKYDGEVSDTLSGSEGVLMHQLNRPQLLKYREALPFLLERDHFKMD